MPGVSGEGPGASPDFTTTQWGMVLAAADSSNPDQQQALTDLCQLYWYPVYAFVRRRGADPDTALDHTQGFFAKLLEKKYLKAADEQRGHFRAFLLTALKFHLSDSAKHDRAQKRGGTTHIVSVDGLDAERRYRVEPVERQTPETLFERRWAMTVLERAMERLLQDHAGSDEQRRATRLAACLTGEIPHGGYKKLAEELGMNEAAAKTALHRLRRRYGALVREEVARIVDDSHKIDDEVRHLFAVLQRDEGRP